MKRLFSCFIIFPLILLCCGCVPLIIGGAAGALGAYAVSKDTVQGETDKPYESLWDAAYSVSKMQGVIRQENAESGYLALDVSKSTVEIHLIRLTHATTRIRVTARKYHLPDLNLAQNLFVKIVEEAK